MKYSTGYQKLSFLRRKILINILVTAIGGGGHGEQVLKALNMSMNKRYRVYGTDANSNCPQKNQVYAFETMPYASDPLYMDKLFVLFEKFRIDVLIHGCEPELELFNKNRKEITDRNVLLLLNSSEVIEIGMNKKKTSDFLLNNGFNPPQYLEINNSNEVDLIDWYPAVVKPIIGGGGSSNVYIVQSKSELLNLAGYLHLDEVEGKFMVQEYVGSSDQEFTVGVLSSLDGEIINSIALKRMMSGQLNIRSKLSNRTSRSELGKNLVISSGVSQGHLGKYPQVTKQCEVIAQKINSKGPLNIQCRLVNGEVKVFEINPRFSGTTSLRAMVGFNEPDILIRRHLLGETIEKNFNFAEQTIMRTLDERFI